MSVAHDLSGLVAHGLSARRRRGGVPSCWFGTVQGRLPQELALEGITGMAAANAYLRETFWPRMKRRFGVEAAERGRAFVALGDVDLEDILCLKEERAVTRDNCVGYRGRQL